MASILFHLNAVKIFYASVFLFLFAPVNSGIAGTIGWFYALDGDKTAFEKIVGPPSRTITLKGGTVVNEYRIGPHKVIVAKMGAGCVTTAVTVARVLALNPLDRVISTGPAGGVGENLTRGAWVNVSCVTAWQKGRAGEGGRLFPGEHAEIRIDQQSGQWPDGEWSRMPNVKLISGEAFIASAEKRRELAAEFKAQIVEMNAFGLLTALEGTNTKVLIFRVVSDFANEQAGEDYAEFLKTYSGNGGAMVAELVKRLPVEKNEPAAHDALRKLLDE